MSNYQRNLRFDASSAPARCARPTRPAGHPPQLDAASGGFTLAELFFGILVLLIGVSVLASHLNTSYRATKVHSDSVFAYTKAQAILAEIQAYVDRGAVSAAIGLDKLDDGVVNKATLTITEKNGVLVEPEHPLSGNIRQHNSWLWWRRISVQPFQGLNNRNLRYVTVRMYKRDKSGVDHQVATLSSVVNSLGSAFPTTQVFDVYLLALENVPGWWVFMESMVPFVESAITDLESRNPGLELRTHWITKASYGRNALYRPFINVDVESIEPVLSSYYYPGRMPSGSSSTFYYVPDMIKARMSFDGVERGGYDETRNPFPYAMADFYNHAMRLPREQAMHKARVDAVAAREKAIAEARAAGVPAPEPLEDMSSEPTLRLFLEDLCTNPDKYRHALIMNLHGELLPMPALRNYSDAAKSPDVLPDVRVVTHPEELRTKRDPSGSGIDDVVLRVYAYVTDPTTHSPDEVMPDEHPIAIQIMGLDLTDPTAASGLIAGVSIEHLQGGSLVGGSRAYSPFQPAARAGNTTQTGQAFYQVELDDPGTGFEKSTLIKLYRTPVRAAPFINPLVSLEPQGLASTRRAQLYGLEYIPSCTGTTADFSHNLAVLGDGPKNTARWTIRIPGSVFANQRFLEPSGSYVNPGADVMLRIRTRIWDEINTGGRPLQTGQQWPEPIQPENYSETYTWWADSPEDVPFTERSQFQGDPRYNPYKDLWNGGDDFPNGYNWYHDALVFESENGVLGYPGLDASRLRSGWRGLVRQDVPRFYELLRTGLVRSGAVYTTLTGFSYYYMGFGNEIGYDAANGYPESIPVNRGPWYTDPWGVISVSNITNYRCYIRDMGTNYWWGMPWLGELYPDRVYTSQWIGPDPLAPRGNLDAAGSTADHFLRVQDEQVYLNSRNRAFGTLLPPRRHVTQDLGCTSFFNIDNQPGRFAHTYESGIGNLVEAGLEVASSYNFPIPPTASINRPFTLTSESTLPDEYSFAPYVTTRGTASLVTRYYDHPSGLIGAGLVSLVDATNASAAYIVVNGLSETVASGSSFIAKWSLLTLVQSFFETGGTGLEHRLKMPARVEIVAPTEITELASPVEVPITFNTSWLRWDGQPYTSSTSSTFAEDEQELEYVVMYSKDNGTTWRHVQDDSLATIGQKPQQALYLVQDSGTGPETVTWETPSSAFPEGSYLLRVECYRQDQALHYSQHQVKIYVTRG